MRNLALAIALTTAAFTSTSFAAKFTPLSSISSAAAEELGTVAALIAQDEDHFGDAGLVEAYTYERKATESDVNTLKQLNHMKVGLNSDDSGATDMNSLSAAALAKHLLSPFEQGDDEAGYKKYLSTLTKVLKAVKADKNLSIYGTTHADEDGTWSVLNILNKSEKEILLIKLGYHGT